MKQVLQLCHSYDPPFLDVARQYATTLSQLGFSVTTIYLKGSGSQDVINGSASEKVIFFKNSSKDIRGLKLKQINQLKEICKDNSFEFILAHRFKSIYIANHIPNTYIIGVHHCFGDYKRFTRRFHIYRNKKNISLLGVSNAIRDDLRSALPKIDSNKIQTIYNRIDYESLSNSQISREESRKHLKLPSDKYIYGNVGRLHKDKDQKTLIKAFFKIHKQHQNSILVILGKGSLESDLRNLVDELDIKERVFFLGMIENASRYYKAFDSFILSSDREPFGMVLLEAMTAGLPIAITDCGGAPEVTGDTAIKFQFGNVDNLSEVLLQIYALNETQINNLKDKMKDRIQENFTDSAILNQFFSFLKTLPLNQTS